MKNEDYIQAQLDIALVTLQIIMSERADRDYVGEQIEDFFAKKQPAGEYRDGLKRAIQSIYVKIPA